MTRLSVNINKVALLRNSRLGNYPDLFQFARDCERFGAEGITVHPRPDERHIRYSDIPILKELVKTEFNIEGYPSRKFLDLVTKVKPDQCTLVPDPPDTLTSDTGWDMIKNFSFVSEVVSELKSHSIRVSLFLDPEIGMLENVKKSGADRIELYTGKYASEFKKNKESAVYHHIITSKEANRLEINVNAGHDLNLDNLTYYKNEVYNLKEVSIGHALIADSLYYGIENKIHLYLNRLR